MFSRRNFLLSLTSFVLAQFLLSCNRQRSSLKVLILEGSIPPQLLGNFRAKVSLGDRLNFKPESQLKDLFDLLQTWQGKISNKQGWQQWVPFLAQGKPQSPANLISLGDAWLSKAIALQLIEPLNSQNLPNWQQLPSIWQQLVKRNNRGELDDDDKGVVWGAPYRWGTTAIAYRSDKIQDWGWTPSDWSDLWREECKGKLSLLDNPRETIGLTLKKLGYSYNTSDLTKIPNLKSELLALHQQVKFYSSDRYLQPLVIGDTWIAVGWSTDFLALKNRYPEIKVVIPRSGTALWTDLWVQPKQTSKITTNNLKVIEQWIDFCWQNQSASEISLFTDAASPIILSSNKQELPQDIRNNSLLLPDPAILDRCEFLKPLAKETIEQYQQLWKEVRKKSKV
jgi:putative spermidine/putrescine transport system substrate-binding protein